jgi:hypothetical protein
MVPILPMILFRQGARGMKKLLMASVTVVMVTRLATIAAAGEKEEAKGKKVDYQVHSGHFESNKSGLKGEASFLAFTDDKSFWNVFGLVPPLKGKKFDYVKPEEFKTKLVVAAIKRGNRIWTYKVEKVTADGDTLYIQYEAVGGKEGSATFASPLIVSVDRGKYTSVVFLENGKKVGTAKIEK